MAKQAGAKKAPASKITEEERLRMIAEAAYHRAQARGSVEGNPDEDWLAAEAEIDAKLKGNHAKTSKAKSTEPKPKAAATKAKSGAKPATGTKTKSGGKAKSTEAKGKGGKK